jgi:hypothetical protein
MKKAIISAFLFLSIQSVFSERIQTSNSFFIYKNSDGSFDWDTFYAEWDKIPDSYYIYMLVVRRQYKLRDKPSLFKSLGNHWNSGYSEKLDVNFGVDHDWVNIEIIFSPNNYGNAGGRIVPFRQKRNNYNKAIENWNYIINQHL